MWNKEIQVAIRLKRESDRSLPRCRGNVPYENYKVVKKEAKKVVREANFKAYDELYSKLGTKDGEKNILKLIKTREMKTRNINGVKCIKDEYQRVLVKEEHIKKRWKSYFDKLFNGNNTKYWSKLSNPIEDRNCRFVRRIRMTEVKGALRRMKMGKAVGPNEIPIEVWKCPGDVGICWLTKLFNKILSSNKMLNEKHSNTYL